MLVTEGQDLCKWEGLWEQKYSALPPNYMTHRPPSPPPRLIALLLLSYQHKEPERLYPEPPVEGPAAPCPCFLWSHHGRTSLSTACVCWLRKRRRKLVNFVCVLTVAVLTTFHRRYKIVSIITTVLFVLDEERQISSEATCLFFFSIVKHRGVIMLPSVIDVSVFCSWQED